MRSICDIIKEQDMVGRIDTEKGMKYSLGDEDFYQEMLAIFLEDYEHNVPKLKSFLADKKYSEYCTLVHGIKNTSKTLGATYFSEMCKAHEEASKEQRYDYVDKQFHELLDEYAYLVLIISGSFDELEKSC